MKVRFQYSYFYSYFYWFTTQLFWYLVSLEDDASGGVKYSFWCLLFFFEFHCYSSLLLLISSTYSLLLLLLLLIILQLKDWLLSRNQMNDTCLFLIFQFSLFFSFFSLRFVGSGRHRCCDEKTEKPRKKGKRECSPFGGPRWREGDGDEASEESTDQRRVQDYWDS